LAISRASSPRMSATETYRRTYFVIAPPPTVRFTLSLHDALPIFGACIGELCRVLLEGCLGLALGLVGLRDVALDRLCSLVEQLRSEEHTSELQSRENLVCRLLLEKKN